MQQFLPQVMGREIAGQDGCSAKNEDGNQLSSTLVLVQLIRLRKRGAETPVKGGKYD